MRLISNEERIQRGCAWCADLQMKNKRRMCPHYECPYHELDEFKNYGEYLKSKGSNTMTAILRELGLGEL